MSEDKTIEETKETIIINLKEIKGEILEIIMDYLNHKVIQYYYKKLKKEEIHEVLHENYQIPADKSLEVLKATILLEC